MMSRLINDICGISFSLVSQTFVIEIVPLTLDGQKDDINFGLTQNA